MKKVLFATMLAALSISCSQTKTFTVQGVLTDATGMNGKMVYLQNMANEQTLDSCIISDGKFTFTRDVDSLQAIIILSEDFSAELIAEAGTINLNVEDWNMYRISGTPLNDQLNLFNDEMAVVDKEIEANAQEIGMDSTLSTDEKYEKISALYKTRDEIINNHFEKNKQSNVGLVVGSYLPLYDLSSAQIDALMQVMAPAAKNFTHFTNARTIALNKETVTIGTTFIDFNGADSVAAPVKLSDYVGKGNYVLVDFWASWCGPCRQSMPALKELSDKYKNKGLVIVGVDVWDKKEAFDKAIADLKITWPQICLFNHSDAITTSYGISSIPTLILFGPEGKIVARDIHTDKANELLMNIYKF